MKVGNVKFHLKPETLEHISKTTRLTKEELYTLSREDAYSRMLERGAIKKPNPIKIFLKNIYKNIGEKLGLLDKKYNIYTHID